MTLHDVEIPVNDHLLIGKLNMPSSNVSNGALLLHPHPRFGGSMDNMIVMHFEQIASDAGMATLRFDFRGAPSNPFSYDGPIGALNDALSAFRILEERIGAGNIGILGYSFGASIGLGVAVKKNLCFLVSLSASRDIFMSTGLGWESLQSVQCPSLLFHGTNDSVISYSDVDAFAEIIGENTEVVHISEEGHFYQNSMNLVGIRIKDFLAGIEC